MLVIGGNAATPAPQNLSDMLALPDHTGYKVALQYSNATQYFYFTPLTGQYWARWILSEQSTSKAWNLGLGSVVSVLNPVLYNDAGITYNGTWYDGGGGSQAIGAGFKYIQDNVEGKYAEVAITPGVGGKIYLVIFKASNGGQANVTINGSTTLVNELSGALLDFYDASALYNQRILIASGLDPSTSYTVRVTGAGTKHASSSGYRMYIEAFGAVATDISAAAVQAAVNNVVVVSTITSAGSSWQYAYAYTPTGATNAYFTGSAHENEVMGAATWLDGLGADKAVSAETTCTSADTIIMTQTGTARHPQTGETDHANITLVITATVDGVTVHQTHTWLTAAVCNAAYVAMMPFASSQVNRGYVGEDNSGSAFTIAADDGSYKGQAQSKVACCWNTAGPWIGWVELEDLTGVNDWAASSPNYMFIEDRSGGVFEKIYATRVGSGGSVNIAISDVWDATTHYHLSYYANAASFPAA